MSHRKLLVTSALPYANGSIHIGHLVEYIQTDAWVRFQKSRGHHCLYMCADDTHGTPVMITAQQQGITPEALIEKIHKEHLQDFTDFGIEFDNYYSTNSPENKEISEYIYQKAKDAGVIEVREIEQYYSEAAGMFLPDRFIKGECPSCSAKHQYGDSCENCGATYTPRDLKNPRCVQTDTIPVLKKSEHHFFKLGHFEDQLRDWLHHEVEVRDEIRKKLQDWFDTGLKDWDISRDEPYFGFKIPGTENKYFYVWLDAPVGYMASTKQWTDRHGLSWEDIWKSGDYEIHHFIGKDITYFHTLFWPAMLMVSGFKLPNRINIHGFLTVNGEKMSKSRGTFVKARTYLNHINPEFLRYYYLSKLSSRVEDIDLSLEDFVNKVNADVVNKIINIGSRLGSIVTKKCDGILSQPDNEGVVLLDTIQQKATYIADCFESLNTRDALKTVIELATDVNQYIDTKAPWTLVKEDVDAARSICTTGLNALRLLMIYLKPVLPGIARGVETFLNCEALDWASLESRLTNRPINAYQHLASRLELADVEKIILPE